METQRISVDDFRRDLFWKATVALPSWGGEFELVFAPEARGDEPLRESELGLVQWFLDHEREVSSAILPALAKEYPRLQADYGYSREELDEYMPAVDSPEELRDLVRLKSVNVHQVATDDGTPLVGFEFGCSWDPEHGLGVLLRGNRVVEIGGADAACLLWLAKKYAKSDSDRRK